MAGSVTKVGGICTYEDVSVNQEGGGGGQGQSGGNQSGGSLKRTVNMCHANKVKEQRKILTLAVAMVAVEHLVVVGEEHKGLDVADANGCMG